MRPALTVTMLALLAGGCLPALPHVERQLSPAFDPISFFDGRTEGLGTLDIRGRAPVVVRVASVGTRTGDSLRLVQTVRLGDDPPYERTFTFRRVGPGRYLGTLTEAAGPVEATAVGNELTIRYATGRFSSVTQRLTLQPSGRLALNLLTARVLGVPVARLTEQIRAVDP